ncbi:MAG: O-antigen ligase family protein [Candidatus Eremiobacteraeota bacterium]|nr:O-antigen ligase family protein [Candidatus Eremiobacteraeota bacterium]
MHSPALLLIAYALVFAAAAVSGARGPRFGVALLIALAPYALYLGTGPTTLTLSKAALAGMAIGLLIYRPPLQTFQSAAFWRLFSAGALLALTTAVSIAHAQLSAPAVRETLKACEYLLLFVVVYAGARLDPDPGLQRIVIAVTVLLVAAVALTQEFFGAPSQIAVGSAIVPRIAGTLEGPNQLAGYLGIALPLLAAFSIQRLDGLIAATILAASAALVLTFSRGGIVSAVIAVAFVLLLSDARVKTTLTFVAGLLAGFAGIAAWALVNGNPAIFWFWTLEASNPGGVGTHGQLWHAAIALWRRHPWSGVGAGNFEYALPAAGLHGVQTHANSLYLQNLAEQGLPGLFATLFLVWQSVAAFWRDARQSTFALGALGASIALALHQIVDLIVFYPKAGGWWWIVMALGAAAIASRKAAFIAEAPAS